MVSVTPVYEDAGQGKKKFKHIKAVVNNTVFEPVPIGYLRVSECKVLEEMLLAAYDEGYFDGAKNA